MEIIQRFEKSPEFQKKVRAVVDLMRSINPGHAVSHEEFERLIDERKETSRYRGIHTAARAILLAEHSIYHRNIRGFGYSHAVDTEHLRAGGNKLRFSVNAWRGGRRIWRSMDEARLSQRVLDQRMRVNLFADEIEGAIVSTVRRCIRSVGAAENHPQIDGE